MNVYKFNVKLNNSMKPKELIQELKVLASLTLTCPLCIDDTFQVLLDLVFCLLSQKSEFTKSILHEELVSILIPLVDRYQCSPKICDAFKKNYHQSPHSTIVISLFKPTIQDILRHKDCKRWPWMKTFVFEYIRALNCQSNGIESVCNFIRSVHGPVSQCPHVLLLNNLVAVCLSAINTCFSTKDVLGKKVTSLNQQQNMAANTITLDKEVAENNLDTMQVVSADVKNTYSVIIDEEKWETVVLFVEVLKEVSGFRDWLPGLACALQPGSFPSETMTNKQLTSLLYPLLERFTEDDRESVVKCLSYSWLSVYSPDRSVCEDNGKLFSKMVAALLKPGILAGKMKKFLATLAETYLQVIMMLASRENVVMIKVLREMLNIGILTDEKEKQNVVSALCSTPSGEKTFKELESHPLTKKTGPKSFTLASSSVDSDLQAAFQTGSRDNLEHLDLSSTHVTSESIDIICRLRNLRQLNLSGTNIDDKGLRILCDYLNLESLNLCETMVTNEGIACLEAMTNLKYLNLNSTEVNYCTVTNLKKNLPNLLEMNIDYTEASVWI
ncbi:unnamed protein product [Clavelina lepadiformis]|uniref:C-Maf-inducing protein n=1 Tax=Clavelina lepadiformis TaxID=159417 RepID=A0ABP0G842_CLALP